MNPGQPDGSFPGDHVPDRKAMPSPDLPIGRLIASARILKRPSRSFFFIQDEPGATRRFVSRRPRSRSEGHAFTRSADWETDSFCEDPEKTKQELFLYPR